MAKIPYLLVYIILCYGIYTIVAAKDRFRRLVGLMVVQGAVILFFVMLGKVARPYALGIAMNPVPSVLMLTAIVVGFAVTCVALSLLAKIRTTKSQERPK